MRNRKGFTLIELLAASWIAVMVSITSISLVSFGQKTMIRQWKGREIERVADAVFEDAARRLVMADGVRLGAPDDSALMEQMDWYKLSFNDESKVLSDRNQQITLYACKEGACYLRLGVRVMERDEILFENSQLLFLLNVNLGKDGTIEVVEKDEIFDGIYEEDEIYYRKANAKEGR